ncbi:MAG: chitobiase/beta-hexosaminidase C-terminal domain-containing protein, partial [Lachnospiraceae bacterium]|nr:chitobiase/beta-hexosaminidase C-terminal domain-containing protein [Lachnospiraceae bacterium]
IVTDLSTCKGLTVNGATLQSGNSLNFSGSNEINIAVGEPCDIKVDYWHTADATIGVGEDTEDIKIETQGGTGSTTYKYRGDGEAIVTIKGGSVRTYISTITITAPSAVTGPAVEANKTINFAGLSGYNKNDPVTSYEDGMFTFSGVKWNDSTHGISVSNGSTISFNLKEGSKAEVDLSVCSTEGTKKATTIEAASGDTKLGVAQGEENKENGTLIYTVLRAAGQVTIKVTSNSTAYIHKMDVKIVTDDRYAVKVTNDGHGTASADKVIASKDDTITLTAEPSTGYGFEKWEVVEGGVTITDNAFTMPEADVEVKAVFESTGPRFEWDFATDAKLTGTNGTTIEGQTGDVKGLAIDARAEGSKWNSATEDGWVQVNKGTKITVPTNAIEFSDGSDGRVKVTVTGKTADYTVNGQTARRAEKAQTFICEKDASVVITMTEDSYINYIKVEELTYAEDMTMSFANKSASDLAKTLKGVNFDKTFNEGENSHGILTNAENTEIVLYLSEKADVTVTTCRFNAGVGASVTASSGTLVKSEWDESGANGLSFAIEEADKGPLTLTVGNNVYIHSIQVSYIVQGVYKEGIDVWDFGAEQLKNTETAKYNNMLDEETINGWYPGVEPGTSGKNIASFELKDENGNVDFLFDDGGFPATHRLRTTNTKLTRFDDKSLKIGSTTYTGYLYSNKDKTKDVYIGVRLNAGDIMTAAVGSNGKAYTITVEDPKGGTQNFVSETKDPSLITYYATKTGIHKIYNLLDEKLVVGRVTRQHSRIVKVSGTVELPEGINEPLTLVFTCKESGMVKEAVVEDGSYEVELYEHYNYDVVVNPATYIIEEGAELELGEANATQTATHDIKVTTVLLRTLSGSIVGLDNDAIEAVDIKFKKPADKLYTPVINIDRTAMKYTAQLESGVEYTMITEGINDYELDNTADNNSDRIKINSAIMGRNITYAKKPVYNVTITPVGVTADDLAEAEFKFTNINEEGYVYTFKGTSGITLRDGTYSVVVSSSYTQKLTSNLVVNGADVTKTIAFDSKPVTYWDFLDNNSYEGGAVKNPLNGLSYTGSGSWKYHGDKYGSSLKDVVISVPVSGSGEVVVTVGYNWDISNGSNKDQKLTDDGGENHLFKVPYTNSSNTVSITVGNGATTYIKAIEVKAASSVEYKPTITVGKDKEYSTINAALDAIRSMNRADASGAKQHVTIAIDPGDYEEMLVIDESNITLKNASAAPSIGLRNKGVDIDPNAVRITSYYGHGYTYYSMGSDCKWNEEVLVNNKANGYPAFTNPGTGTTSGSYWNATVVINGSNVSAQGIIFENSFNQYISKKAAEDIIIAQSGAKEGSVPRASMAVGDTTVQQKSYVERAAALAIYDNCASIFFDNCKFVGRQDTLYGGKGTTAAFYDCSIYGGTDYIFGGMKAVFAKCDLVFNTSDVSGDYGYITAAQQSSGRGYLMYNCHVTSTTPGVDTASAYTSKPGYLGRPWQANTGEAVFYKTVVDEADAKWQNPAGSRTSLIEPAGWGDGLGGKSVLSQEYGTYEVAEGVNNSSKRVSWSTVLTDEKLSDGSDISVGTFLGTWNPFDGKVMDVVLPSDSDKVSAPAEPTVIVTPEPGTTGDGENPVKTVIKGASIVLSAETGAKIYYNVNGTDNPTENSDLYTGAIEVSDSNINNNSITIKAIAVKYGKTSTVATFTYSVTETPDTAAPAFNPASGDVKLGSRITMSAEAGAEIHYTVDGSEPTDASTLYSGKDGVEIKNAIINKTDSTVTIKAIAIRYGKASSVTDVTYNVLVNAPVADPKTGYQFPDGGGKVKLTADEGVDILYTIGDTPADPTAEGSSPETYDKSGDGIAVNASTTIKAVAKRGTKYSDVITLSYRVPLSMPTATPESGTALSYGIGGKVKLDSNEKTATIYYTIATGDAVPADPTDENSGRKTYDRSAGYEGIEITEKTTIKAVAESGGKYSTVAVFTYDLEDPTPTANPRSGKIQYGRKVKLDSAVESADIYYTIGADPADPTTDAGVKYDRAGEGIEIKEDTTIKAVVKIGDTYCGDVATFTYTVEIPMPTADPESGFEFPGRSGKVKLDSVVENAKIYYTTATGDAVPADPTDADTEYDRNGEGISVTENTLIKAVAKVGSKYSKVAFLAYTCKGSGSTKPGAGLEVELLSGKEYTYTGSAITPEIKVTNNGDELTLGVDYTVKYSNNKNANAGKDEKKKAKITVTGKGSFSGSAFTYFTINPKSLAEDEDDENPVKAGSIKVVKKKKVAPILFYNGVKLTAKDFTIEGNSKFDDAGDKSVKVNGKGNFTGNRDIPVKVVNTAAELDKITSVVLAAGEKYVYDGTEKAPKFTVKSGQTEVKNSDGVEDKYTIVYNRDIINAGTVKFTVIGIGEYTGSVTKSYKITPNKSANITAALAETSYEYVSTGVTVPDKDLTVTVGDTPLTKGVDYKVAYSGNKKVTKGNATAKCNVTFIGNYKGCAKKTLTFAITPATINDDTVTVFAADKVFKKANVYKSVPSVVYEDEDGVKTLLKKSDYNVKYYLDEACTDAQEMTSRNKVMAAGTTVYVKVTGKGNYASSAPTAYAIGEYKVRDLGSMKDLSKAKIEIWDKVANKKTTKVEYTGEEIEFDGTRYELKVNLGTAKKPDYVLETEYDVEYANNINKGKATIIITAKDTSETYLGSKTGTFSIIAQKVKPTLLNNLFGSATQNLSDFIGSLLTNE